MEMFAVQALDRFAIPTLVWFRKYDRTWTHHRSRIQYYPRAEAQSILEANQKFGGLNRVEFKLVPAHEVA